MARATTQLAGEGKGALFAGRGGRRNPLAQALQEYGRLFKTNFALAWLADEELRARIGRQLNKGEQLHAPFNNLTEHY